MLFSYFFISDIAVFLSEMIGKSNPVLSGWVGSYGGGTKTFIMYLFVFVISLLAYFNLKNADNGDTNSLKYILILCMFSFVFLRARLMTRLIMSAIPLLSISVPKIFCEYNNRVKDRVVVFDNIKPTVEFNTPTTDSGKYSDTGEITIDEFHIATYQITIKDIFNMHTTLDLSKLVYSLAGQPLAMSKVSDSISGKYINVLNGSSSAIYTGTYTYTEYEETVSVKLSYKFISFTHTFDVANGSCVVDASTCSEELIDTLVLEVTISEATGDGLVKLHVNSGVMTDLANNANDTTVSPEDILVDNTIPVVETDISSLTVNNIWYDLTGLHNASLSYNYGSYGYTSTSNSDSRWINDGLRLLEGDTLSIPTALANYYTIELLIKLSEASSNTNLIVYNDTNSYGISLESCSTGLCHITIRRDSHNAMSYSINSGIDGNTLVSTFVAMTSNSANVTSLTINGQNGLMIYGIRQSILQKKM